MESETAKCKNCKEVFDIEVSDLDNFCSDYCERTYWNPNDANDLL